MFLIQLLLTVLQLMKITLRKSQSSLLHQYQQVCKVTLVSPQARKQVTVHLILRCTQTSSSSSQNLLEMVFCFRAGQCLTVLWKEKKNWSVEQALLCTLLQTSWEAVPFTNKTMDDDAKLIPSKTNVLSHYHSTFQTNVSNMSKTLSQESFTCFHFPLFSLVTQQCFFFCIQYYLLSTIKSPFVDQFYCYKIHNMTTLIFL